MWLFTSFGFFSVVRKPDDAHLTIRSRTLGDLQRLRRHYLPKASEPIAHAGSDYPWRIVCDESELAAAMQQIVADIDYANFKDEVVLVTGSSRAKRYAKVWGALHGMEEDCSDPRRWLRQQARGSERYGIVVSSQALRLKPHAIDVRAPVDPVNWFLNPKDDVRSSYYLEDVATEFQVQGLELDWVGVVWDADLRHQGAGWKHHSFVGDRWQHIHKPDRRLYLKNAYRVLLTRARQGMVIVVPQGAPEDPTRDPAFYDGTYRYLREIGIQEVTL